jgi:ABC-type Mn2+/Zn2+ transport system permease subunit
VRTPAAAAQRLSGRAGVVTVLSVLFALIAADRGLVVHIVYVPDFRARSFITFIAFGIYLLARAFAAVRRRSLNTPAGTDADASVDEVPAGA